MKIEYLEKVLPFRSRAANAPKPEANQYPARLVTTTVFVFVLLFIVFSITFKLPDATCMDMQFFFSVSFFEDRDENGFSSTLHGMIPKQSPLVLLI